jgi:hypothetical protein
MLHELAVQKKTHSISKQNMNMYVYNNLESTRPRNRWQHEVREDGRVVSVEQ